MIWAGMLGAGLAMKDDAHIGIDFVVRALPNSIQFIAKVIAKLVVGNILDCVLSSLLIILRLFIFSVRQPWKFQWPCHTFRLRWYGIHGNRKYIGHNSSF